MRNMKWIIVFLSLLIALPVYAIDGTALLKQVDRNLSPDVYESYRKLINIEPDGKKKEFTLFTVKQGIDKVASLYIAPASEKGRSTLRLGAAATPVSTRAAGRQLDPSGTP